MYHENLNAQDVQEDIVMSSRFRSLFPRVLHGLIYESILVTYDPAIAEYFNAKRVVYFVMNSHDFKETIERETEHDRYRGCSAELMKIFNTYYVHHQTYLWLYEVYA